eukprot:GHVU01155401.1.p1 GENE.GHVU01155401.1~~GHVU01155401.1.p1  ORF type:complete len:472 (+),score=56.56 GHVU01155401.1:64-1479(+)
MRGNSTSKTPSAGTKPLQRGHSNQSNVSDLSTLASRDFKQQSHNSSFSSKQSQDFEFQKEFKPSWQQPRPPAVGYGIQSQRISLHGNERGNHGKYQNGMPYSRYNNRDRDNQNDGQGGRNQRGGFNNRYISRNNQRRNSSFRNNETVIGANGGQTYDPPGYPNYFPACQPFPGNGPILHSDPLMGANYYTFRPVGLDRGTVPQQQQTMRNFAMAGPMPRPAMVEQNAGPTPADITSDNGENEQQAVVIESKNNEFAGGGEYTNSPYDLKGNDLSVDPNLEDEVQFGISKQVVVNAAAKDDFQESIDPLPNAAMLMNVDCNASQPEAFPHSTPPGSLNGSHPAAYSHGFIQPARQQADEMWIDSSGGDMNSVDPGNVYGYPTSGQLNVVTGTGGVESYLPYANQNYNVVGEMAPVGNMYGYGAQSLYDPVGPPIYPYTITSFPSPIPSYLLSQFQAVPLTRLLSHLYQEYED